MENFPSWITDGANTIVKYILGLFVLAKIDG
jgi:hypothetical protein